MDALLAVLGAALIAVVAVDVVATTLVPRGGGPLSALLARGLWRAALGLHRRRPSHRLLAHLGPVVMLLSVALWATLTWLGATLLFASGPRAVVRSADGTPAGLLDRAYYAGYTLITLGNGDFRPGGGAWQVLTVLLAGFGFFLFTLSIAYLLSVLSAATHKRQLAGYIGALGTEPLALVERQHLRGGTLLEHQIPLMSSIGLLAQQHLAYPVLHYFHAGERRYAFPLRLATLDEALGITMHGLAEHRAEAERLEPLRNTIGAFLASLEALYLDPEESTPPPVPSLEPLRRAGFEVVPHERFREEMARVAKRRRQLLSLVRNDGWKWDDLAHGEAPGTGERPGAPL